MKTAFLFPGQGAQFVGMGKDLYDSFPEARDIFVRADQILGFSLSEIMFGLGENASDSDEILKQTDITQPALYVKSLAAMSILTSQDIHMHMDVAAGHSLGEYSALAAVGAIDFESGLRVVRLRGRLMSEAGTNRVGTMAAVLGMDDDLVATVCREVSEMGEGIVQPANYNAPGQVVISGDTPAVERSFNRFKERGARRVVPLAVSGAFHSPLMEEAREGLSRALQDLEIKTPGCPVYLNVTGRATSDPGEIRFRLLEQLTAPVRWSQTLQQMKSDGVVKFVEVGAGSVLSGLVKRTLGRDHPTFLTGSASEIQGYMDQSKN